MKGVCFVSDPLSESRPPEVGDTSRLRQGDTNSSSMGSERCGIE